MVDNLNPNGVGLIVIGVLLLALPGIVVNNLYGGGLIPASDAMTCGFTAGAPTCVLNTSVGCSVNPAYCNLSGSAISLLNGRSPFTQLLEGNIYAVFNQITTGSQSVGHGPFDEVGNPNYFLANCVVYRPTAGSKDITALLFRACQTANSDGSNATKSNSQSWDNWNGNYNGSTSTLYFHDLVEVGGNGSSPVGFVCTYNIQTNYTFAGTPYSGYTWFGCDAWDTQGVSCSSPLPQSCLTSTKVWSFLVSLPLGSWDLSAAKGYSCGSGIVCWNLNNIPVQLEGWETFACFATQGVDRPTYAYLVSSQCDQWFATNTSLAQGSGESFGVLSPLVTFIVGLALVFLGSGIGFAFGGSVVGTGTNASVFSNPQGTKMAQVIGGGLVVWSFMYSEFSTWFTSGYFPYGLDGAFGAIGLAITGIFFFGLYITFIGGNPTSSGGGTQA